MNKLKNKNLAFFIVDLSSLNKIGMLNREIEPYNILAEHFNKIYIFTCGGKEELVFKKYLSPNIEIINNNTSFSKKIYSFISPIVHRKIIKQCDFLKTNQMRGGHTAIIAKIINPKARLIVRTGYTWSLFATKQGRFVKFISFLEKIAYKYCHAGLVTSKNDKEYLIKKYKIKDNKIKIIPNYINTELFKPDFSQKKYDDKIIYVGRLDQQKNLFNLIKALENTNIILDIVGSGDLKNELEQLANNLKVKINFLGNILNQQLPKILNKYKVFILPSFYEGMPKSLLEAMSCGVACIGTKVDGTKEVIQDSITGLLSDTDAKSLRQTILKLINDQELQINLGQKAREFIIENYSLKTQIKKELQIYESLL